MNAGTYSLYALPCDCLGRNVNLTARLEAATAQFGTHMLLSEFFTQELSPAARRYCRLLDRVMVKGSAIPMELWTFDISAFPRHFKEPIIDQHGYQLPVDFETDEEFKQLQAGIDPRFFAYFKKGVDAYFAGRWMQAKASLESALTFQTDGPAQTLIEFMRKTDFNAPSGWKGYRALTSK